MVLPKEKPCIHPIYFGITSFPTTIINNNFNDVFFRRLRRLLTFDQISLVLIAEISLIRKFFDVCQCNAIESYIQEFRYREKHKKCANYLSRTKTHHICTDTCLSFLYFSSRLTTSTYTKAKEAHNTYCVRLLTFLQKGKHQILKTVCLNIFFNTTCQTHIALPVSITITTSACSFADSPVVMCWRIGVWLAQKK